MKFKFVQNIDLNRSYLTLPPQCWQKFPCHPSLQMHVSFRQTPLLLQLAESTHLSRMLKELITLTNPHNTKITHNTAVNSHFLRYFDLNKNKNICCVSNMFFINTFLALIKKNYTNSHNILKLSHPHYSFIETEKAFDPSLFFFLILLTIFRKIMENVTSLFLAEIFFNPHLMPFF